MNYIEKAQRLGSVYATKANEARLKGDYNTYSIYTNEYNRNANEMYNYLRTHTADGRRL